MNLLDRYIIGAVLKGVAIVVCVLLAVGTFIEFIGQLDDVGKANYELDTALTYITLRTPRLIFQMLPAAALVGALFSLGNFAVHRELVVMRAAGVSRLRLIVSV
ncbi:MAG: LptF/LptG family permease, partial [Gammaproteobacteria bacterium]